MGSFYNYAKSLIYMQHDGDGYSLFMYLPASSNSSSLLYYIQSILGSIHPFLIQKVSYIVEDGGRKGREYKNSLLITSSFCLHSTIVEMEHSHHSPHFYILSHSERTSFFVLWIELRKSLFSGFVHLSSSGDMNVVS